MGQVVILYGANFTDSRLPILYNYPGLNPGSLFLLDAVMIDPAFNFSATGTTAYTDNRVQPVYGEIAMAKLMKASKWGKREFTKDSIPDNRTIKRWVENGLLTGKIVDGTVFVYESEKWGVDSMVNHTVLQLINEG